MSACIQSIGFLIGDYHTAGSTCQFQGFLIQFFNWSTILWVCAISIYILLQVRQISPSRFEKWFHVLCWGVPFIFACIPFGGGKYGRSGVWCWIKHDETALRFGIWYVPKILLIVAMIVIYAYLLGVVLRRRNEWNGVYNAEEQHDKLMLVKEVKPLVWFPVIYVLLGIPSLIYRIDDAINPHTDPNYTLSVLMVIASPSVGALNAVAYAVYTEILNQLSWNQIKFHFISHFTKGGDIIHNIDVDDGPIVGDLGDDDEWEQL